MISGCRTRFGDHCLSVNEHGSQSTGSNQAFLVVRENDVDQHPPTHDTEILLRKLLACKLKQSLVIEIRSAERLCRAEEQVSEQLIVQKIILFALTVCDVVGCDLHALLIRQDVDWRWP